MKRKKIGEWDTQKATTEIYGRKWTAWFAENIPFQDGAYKFNGLPGLIIKISDQNQNHVFELKAIKNLAGNEDWESFGLKNNYSKPISLNQDKFKKVYQKYRKDPIAGIRQMMNQSGVKLEMTDENGKIIDIKKGLSIRQKV